MSDFDVVVLGAGPGGYVAAIRCAQHGLKTACIEQGLLGGVCLNVGCIPSKALIHASKTYKKAKDGANMGILARDIGIDMVAMQKWKSGITSQLSKGIGMLFKGNGVTHIQGRGVLSGPGQVVVRGADGSEQRVGYKQLILATGSSPIQIPGFPFDNEAILDSTGALALAQVPASLAVIGGGVIGLELTDVYARLGAQVTVIEATDRLLPGIDADVVQPVERKQKKMGVKHLLSTKAVSQRQVDGLIELTLESAGKPLTLQVEKVLVAVGRRPNTRDLGLETIGLSLDARGQIPVDAQQRTAIAGVLAIGDITPGPMLAHKASREGEVAAEFAAGHSGAAMDPVCIPNVVYTDPEIATVGPSLADLQKSGKPIKIGKFGFGALGRAMTANATDGFARMISDSATDTVLAVQIVGAEASELIAEAGLALEMAATTQDIALTIHSHPTMAEALLEAAHTALGHPLHALK